ncbi:hypothetical protein B0T22DRAFT_382186 [Podospora appendiculata]|uniref:FAD-binding domain-containing protein n=1 Tax=Podospora appendiculata TaxID=314037 RepID=A0AAE0X6H8_9PEZI|nr:hypothetical protein B0T22DRAFT_382186 [Podospora appendiculata]
MPEKGFRAILVGGGPVGLMAAHTLSRAGIDFVLLERRETVVPEQGAGIVLYPHTLRVLQQLGLLDAVRTMSLKIHASHVITKDGHHFVTLHPDRWTREYHGVGWLFMHRPDLLRLLYSSLPDRVMRQIHAGKDVKEIETTDDGVIVRCSDGTAESGSIVIGADGVHSNVRGFMFRAMRHNIMQPSANSMPGAEVPEDNRPFLVTYRCLFGNTAKALPGVNSGESWDMHSAGVASQLFVGEDRTWFLLYQKLQQPTRERTTYTSNDQDRFVDEVGDAYVTPALRLRDLYNARQWSMLLDLHEGMVDSFSAGRIVLVGDAINKQAPNHGHGWNCGVQDVVVLTNILSRLVRGPRTSTCTWSSASKMHAAFHEYHDTRLSLAKKCQDVSAAVIRGQTWDSWTFWLVDRYFVPWTGLGKRVYGSILASVISGGHVLEFLDEGDTPTGSIPWKHCVRQSVTIRRTEGS